MKKAYYLILVTAFFALQISCLDKKDKSTETAKDTIEGTDEFNSNLNSADFDTVIDGKKVGLYWIMNDGVKVAFTNYGARVVGLWVKDKRDQWTDVVVGLPSTEAYIKSTEPYFGATIGRVGNRIAKGNFTLNDRSYTIPQNNGENALHGGKKGFQAVVWEVDQPTENTLKFRYDSPDMEQGFPGNLEVMVTYSVTSNNSLLIKYQATTDKTTPVNLTNHAFFNLNGEGSGTILNHLVKFDAYHYTPVDDGLIPTGEILPVVNTPFDFSDPHTIGERIDDVNQQLEFGLGYDHNFVVDSLVEKTFKKVSTIEGDISGIIMDVYTEEPGLQFYSGNFMKGQNTFKSGAKDDHRTAFALETQHFPDAPNQKNFPSIYLGPGELYTSVTEYGFSKKK